eukprot:8742696-Alexandrium_andersonii.AAC.1
MRKPSAGRCAQGPKADAGRVGYPTVEARRNSRSQLLIERAFNGLEAANINPPSLTAKCQRL